jgi:hypothetical protein
LEGGLEFKAGMRSVVVVVVHPLLGKLAHFEERFESPGVEGFFAQGAVQLAMYAFWVGFPG